MRIGWGTDLHRLTTGDGIILGGVNIPAPFAVIAHSDGDVLLHALTDALLGALGAGDIGELFPDTAAENRQRASADFVKAAMALMLEKNFRVGNVDITIHLETPKLSAYKNAIRENLARLLHVAASAVNVKAKTSEQIGAVGEQRALRAEVIILIE